MYRILFGHGFFNLARAFIGAVLVYYLIDNGISISTIAIAKSCQLCVSVLCNYPASLISNKYGNKISIILSCIFSIIYFYLMINPTEFSVIIGEVFNGLSIAFYVGSYESWIFRYKNNRENNFTLLSRSSEILFFTTIVAGLAGAYFNRNSFYLSIIFMVWAIAIYIMSDEVRNKRDNFNYGIKYFVRYLDLGILFYIFFTGLMQILYQFWIIYFSKILHLSQIEIGYLFVSIMLFQWILTYLSRKVKLDRIKHAITILVSLVFIASLFVVFLPYLTKNSLIIIISYLLLSSSCAILANLLFSKYCCSFSNEAQSSMFSLIDASARAIGAIILAMIATLNLESNMVFLAFPLYLAVSSLIWLFYKKDKIINIKSS